MPRRNITFATGEYYHIFNRSIGREAIFNDEKSASRAIDTISYYRYANVAISYSKLKDLKEKERFNTLKRLAELGKQSVDIITFCLMPNHYHLLIKQNEDEGIVKFIKNFQASCALYYNTKFERKGPLFETRFKAKLINNNNQLLHVSRYTHINPYTSNIVNTADDLLSYPWSSLPEYLGSTKGFCNKEVILNNFTNAEKYKEFILDNADYQRSLKLIKDVVMH